MKGNKKDLILDICFPPRCAICDKTVSSGEKHICEKCRSKLKYIEGPTCYRCGKEVDYEEEEYCSDCKRRERTFDKGYPVFRYTSPISDSLMSFKYFGRQEYAVYYAEAIKDRFGEELKSLKCDALVPVPINKKKYSTRGYNQAELIAVRLGRLLDIPVVTDLLVRTSNTDPQKGLNDAEREKNLLGAFSIKKEHPEIKSVILVDDIYTSGATIECCTKVLRSSGVERIYFTAVAIGVSN